MQIQIQIKVQQLQFSAHSFECEAAHLSCEARAQTPWGILWYMNEQQITYEEIKVNWLMHKTEYCFDRSIDRSLDGWMDATLSVDECVLLLAFEFVDEIQW